MMLCTFSPVVHSKSSKLMNDCDIKVLLEDVKDNTQVEEEERPSKDPIEHVWCNINKKTGVSCLFVHMSK